MKKTYDRGTQKNEERFADGDKKAVRRRQNSEVYREKTADGLCGCGHTETIGR